MLEVMLTTKQLPNIRCVQRLGRILAEQLSMVQFNRKPIRPDWGLSDPHPRDVVPIKLTGEREAKPLGPNMPHEPY